MSRTALPPREATLHAVQHPDPLRLDGEELPLVDDPRLAPLRDGEPLFGWDGDTRLAMYVSRKRGSWELYRLENDGVYRLVTRRRALGTPLEGLVASLIMHLVSHDVRRGYDVKAAVDEQNAALDRAARKAMADRVDNELAPKMRWALHRDGALNHTSGATKQEMVDFGRHLDEEEQAEAI